MSEFIVYSKNGEIWTGVAFDADEAADYAGIENYTTSTFAFERGDADFMVWLM